jgi:chromosome segregation ATPase
MQKTNVMIAFLVLLIVGLGVAGYFAFPVLIQKQTEGLRADVQALQERLQKAEGFIQQEQDARKKARLKPDADLSSVIAAYNGLSTRVDGLDSSVKKQSESVKRDLSKVDERIKSINTKQGEDAKKQAEALEDYKKSISRELHSIQLDSLLANIRAHILKARVELAVKNIDVTKSEIDMVDGLFTKAVEMAQGEKKKALTDLQQSLRKTKADLDINLSLAGNRLDIVWYETGKLQSN